MYQPIGKIITFISVIFALSVASCGSTKEDPDDIDKVILANGNPGSDARCTCKQSSPALLTNTDTSTARFVKTNVTIKLPNQAPVISPRTDVLNPNAQLFLGCTIDPIGEPAACLQVNSFEKIDESTLRFSSSVPAGTVVSSPFFINDIPSCAALCTHGAACYSLGKDASPIAVPFLTLIDAANSGDGTIIKKSDVLEKYNLKASDDKCQRGDITRKGLTVFNEGMEKCELSAGKITQVKLPDDIAFFLPKMVQGNSILVSSIPGAKSTSPNDKAILFENVTTGPAISFSGNNGKDLTDLYGGRVRSIARIGTDLIFSNSNGCMRIKLN